MLRAIAVFALLAIAQAGPVLAQTTVTFDGDGVQAKTLSVDDLRKLARTSITTKDAKGVETTYEGVLLGDLLAGAGVPIKQQLKGTDISKYLHVEGNDGYVAVFSLPEFDTGRFLVADRMNGADLPSSDGPTRIVAPDDSRRSRWVRQLKLLRIKRSTP